MATLASGGRWRTAVHAGAVVAALVACPSATAQDLRIWRCQGEYRAAPEAAAVQQERTLEFHRASGKAVMRAGGRAHEGRYRAAPPHLAAAFEIAAADGPLRGELSLGMTTGRLAVYFADSRGTRWLAYRGLCTLAPAARAWAPPYTVWQAGHPAQPAGRRRKHEIPH